MKLSNNPAFGWQTEYCQCPFNTVTDARETARYRARNRYQHFQWTDTDEDNAVESVKKVNAKHRRNFNRIQLICCIPIVSLIMGIIRIGQHTIGYHVHAKNKNSHIVRGIMEIAQLGLILLAVDAIVTLFRTVVVAQNSHAMNPIYE